MEKTERLLWRIKLRLYFFFKRLLKEVRLELEARKHYGRNAMARRSYKTWVRNRIRFSDLTSQEQSEWLEEEASKLQDYYDDLL